MKAPFLKKVTLSWESLAIVFPAPAIFYSGDVFWVYWHHYFVLSFPHCLKSCSVSNICLIPSKLFQNSLAYLKRRISSPFQNKLLGMTFCRVLIWHSSSFFRRPLWFFAVHTSKPRALSHSTLAACHHIWRACAAASSSLAPEASAAVCASRLLLYYWTERGIPERSVDNWTVECDKGGDSSINTSQLLFTFVSPLNPNCFCQSQC